MTLPGQSCASSRHAHEDNLIWNLCWWISLLGADVTVIRNDSISPELFSQLQINSLVISPGPGHPTTDSGISRYAINNFMSKVPVMSVDMGLVCLADVHGGR